MYIKYIYLFKKNYKIKYLRYFFIAKSDSLFVDKSLSLLARFELVSLMLNDYGWGRIRGDLV